MDILANESVCGSVGVRLNEVYVESGLKYRKTCPYKQVISLPSWHARTDDDYDESY